MKFTLHFEVQKSADVVFQHLSEPHLFAQAHPLIQRITALPDGRWKIYEKIQLGWLPYAFTYPARFSHNRALNEVQIDAVVYRITRISIQFKVVEQQRGCSVLETVHIKAPIPVGPVLKRVFTAQHPLLFNHINTM